MHLCDIDILTLLQSVNCAKRIVNAGIARVVWHEHYESRYGDSGTVADYLKSAGVQVVSNLTENLAVDRFKELLATVDLERLDKTGPKS